MYLEFSKLFARNPVDPEQLTLIAFGGAGPMVGCALARELGLRQVLVPRAPGVVCALGGLVAEIRNDRLRTVMLPLQEASIAEFRDTFAALEQQAHAWLVEVGEPAAAGVVQRSADMRYRGQSYEIEVPLDAIAPAAMAASFHARHLAVFDHSDPAADIEVVNLRLAIRAGAPRVASPLLPRATAPPVSRPISIFIDGAWTDVKLYGRADLLPGHAVAGPAVVAQEDATLLLPPHARASVQQHGHLLVTL